MSLKSEAAAKRLSETKEAILSVSATVGSDVPFESRLHQTWSRLEFLEARCEELRAELIALDKLVADAAF